MTEQQTEQQSAKDSLGKAMKRSEKVFLGLLIFAVATGLFIRFVPVSFLGVDVVALSPGSAPTTIEKINIEGAQTYAPDGEQRMTRFENSETGKIFTEIKQKQKQEKSITS